MRPIIFLSSFMKLGYGVSVVIDQLSQRLVAKGHTVVVGTLEKDNQYSGYAVVKVQPTLESVKTFLGAFDNPIVFIHTSPFFEMTNELSKEFEIWAYEHGDPEPTLFEKDAVERAKIKSEKLVSCYPHAKGVICISEFIRSDISWPQGHIVLNGCDHVTDLGKKGPSDLSLFSSQPLRIGTLMRFGEGEAKYKGNELFTDFVRKMRSLNFAADFSIAGRGSQSDVKGYLEEGIAIHLNLSDEERENYLRKLDVFVSFSQWEGFNLPLVEAQALGTLSFAFDVGAHPEVCPFIFESLDEMIAVFREILQKRQLLQIYSDGSYDFVRKSFKWDEATDKICALATLSSSKSNGASPMMLKLKLSLGMNRFLGAYRRHEFLGMIKIVFKKSLTK